MESLDPELPKILLPQTAEIPPSNVTEGTAAYGESAPQSPISVPRSGNPLVTSDGRPLLLPDSVPTLPAPNINLSTPSEPYLPSRESRLPASSSPPIPSHISLPDSVGETLLLPAVLPQSTTPESPGPPLPLSPAGEDVPNSTGVFQTMPDSLPLAEDRESLRLLGQIIKQLDRLAPEKETPRPAGPTQLSTLLNHRR